MRQQKRRPSLSLPARNRESWRAPSLPLSPVPRPPPAWPPDTHRGVCPRPARPCCHRPAPADTGAPSALSAGRLGARGQLTRHLAKNTAASHPPPRTTASAPRPCAPLTPQGHFHSIIAPGGKAQHQDPGVCLGVGGTPPSPTGLRAPQATEPHRPPSCRCGR